MWPRTIPSSLLAEARDSNDEMHTTAHERRWFTKIVPFLLIPACSAGAGPDGLHGSVVSSGACEPENLTLPCKCGAANGSQTCLSGTWASCDCATSSSVTPGGGSGGAPAIDSSTLTFAGNLRTDITFNWQSTAKPVDDGSCPPGQYEGNLQGLYYSMLNPTPVPLPITNVDTPGAPSGFHFTLSPAQGGEITQAVQGEVDGLADALFPFKAQIQGQLNCSSGVFTGQMTNGTYSILVSGLLPQSFDGVMSARYDKPTHTFVDGQWDVRETSATPPGKLAPSQPRDLSRDGYGGSGQFAAALPTDLTDPNLKPCPSSLTCGAGLLGPNKLLCNNALGTPTCNTDADCAASFPGETVPCLKASLFSLCLRECKP